MRKHKLQVFVVVFALFLAFIYTLATGNVLAADAKRYPGTVTRVSDGDTVHVTTAEGTKMRIRLYGMDAPETEKRDRNGRVKSPGQPYGDVAESALKGKIGNRQVIVEAINVDRYHRIVGVIWLDGRCINLEMVREGHAEAYREYLQVYRQEFLSAEAAAKKERRGIWAMRQYERPGDFRKRMRLSGEY